MTRRDLAVAQQMHKWVVILIALLLAGCVVEPEATQTPFIVTATPAPDPTPTQEYSAPPDEMMWYPGCELNPHCDSDMALVAVNENSSLSMGTAQSETECVLIYHEGLPYQRCRVVDTPAPYGLYRWYFEDASAVDGELVYEGATPDTREVPNGYTLNVSGMRGFMGLDLVHQSVYAGLGRYVVGAEFDSIDLHTYDPDVSLNQAINKQCIVHMDNGAIMPLPPQAWVSSGNSLVYVLQFSTPRTFLLRCGVYLPYPSVDGQVVFTRIFVAPVGPEYAADNEGVVEIP